MITPPVTLITHSVVAVAAAAGAWVWQANSYEAKLAAVQTEYAQAQARAVEIAHADTIRLQAQASKAAAAAATRIHRLSADRDRLRAAADGLRNDLATAALRLPDATPDAVIEYATALDSVFLDCTARYEQLATKADGHASDVQTMIESWPK